MPTLPSAPIRMLVRKTGHVRIHTFISSYDDDNIANATHIIESANKLVLIDSQFLVPYALQFREYADSLKKPIDRLYLSHRHPDHWFGLAAAFSDVDVHTLSETKLFIEQHGEASRQDHWKLGDLVPDRVVVPQHTVDPGATTIDGVDYEFDRVTDTEIDFLLTIRLPKLGVQIVQDLIYSGTHLYLTKDIGHWIQVLQGMLVSDDDLFLAGHGLPADKREVARNIEYLSAARHAIGAGITSPDFKDFLIKRYPNRLCPGIFDIYVPRLFDNASQY